MLTVLSATANMRASPVGALSESVRPNSHGGDSDRAGLLGRLLGGGAPLPADEAGGWGVCLRRGPVPRPGG